MHKPDKKLFRAILVTGCGGDIGLSLGKILKIESVAEKIVGSDIHNQHPGKFIFDFCEVIERADSPKYLTNLKDIIKRHNIDLIIPMSEAEIRFFSKEKITDVDRTPLLMPNYESRRIGLDKLETSRFLKTAGLLYPWTQTIKEGTPKRLPCIIKARFGSGSKEFNIVNEENLDYYLKKDKDLIFQERLLPGNEEYTCGVYRSRKGEVRVIIFKRRLLGGYTNYGEITENMEISEMLLKLAEKINLTGSINVQVILTERGPITFEINPRFSSTVLFRHLVGFKDLIWSLQEQKGITPQDYISIGKGTKIYKGFQEYVLFKDNTLLSVNTIKIEKTDKCSINGKTR